ncbi:hypothetical protein LOAG_17262 [Loa loa]|uniref:CWF19-like protein 2 homolog n=1 Tax=Loa loa TaxID=7209 RepID=A0A1I7VTK7_LOALO|nr:hypothetical protein LOAG_17262 [Loa loa]EJD75617.1 hypothetical protein LOAG_17262 [Loa loa]
MSRFLKPIDYSDDEDESCLVRAKPIDPKFARKLGSYAAGKDFVTKSVKSQQELEESIVIVKNSPNTGEIRNEETNLERHNKLGAKILKAKLQGKTSLIKKLEKELHTLKKDGQGPSSTCKILLRTDGGDVGDVVIPATMKQEEKNLKSRGSVDAIYHANKSIHDIVADEKAIGSADHIFSTVKAAAKYRMAEDWIVDDAMMSVKRSRMREAKEQRRNRNNLIKENKIYEQTLDSCRFCVEAVCFRKHCMVACGNSAYLSSVPWRPLIKEHCLVVPITHYSSTVTLDENVYEEIQRFKRALVSMWHNEKMDCLFVETAKNVKHRKHMYIECIAVPSKIGEMAPIYFKKAIDDSEGEWVDNKKLVDLSKRGGNIRKVIPKGFSYFAVDFGLQSGYAHVIENEDQFPQNFAHEIIGGMMDLERRQWRMNECLTVKEQLANTAELKRLWEPFDWTKESKNDK